MTLAAPTASPPIMRAKIKNQELCAAPAAIAETRNSAAEIIRTARRPQRSARLPAKKAPMAQPINIEATSNPVKKALDWKVCLSPSTVPLITPLSKPNRKPPIVATQLIRMMKRVFSPASGAPSMETLDMGSPGNMQGSGHGVTAIGRRRSAPPATGHQRVRY